MPSVADIVDYLERFAPIRLAAEWDNVGLILGDRNAPAERIMTCLTITPPVVVEAVEERAELIVTHHPVLFRATKQITTQSPEGRLLLPLLRAGIAVHAPHTSFDNCQGGINDGLCAKLGLGDLQPLRAGGEKQFKLVVFVPDSDLTNVTDALFAAGAGRIGQYEECSFRSKGTGTFHGTEATNPTVGQKGRREAVDEWRLEVVVPSAALPNVIRAVRTAHSYEEPAFDIYPLHGTAGSGEGRIGSCQLSLGELAKLARERLRANHVQIVGDPNRVVRRVAVACGAAGEFLKDAIQAKVDAFLTGEVRFHDALSAQEAGIGLVLPGHYATERPAVEDLAVQLRQEFPQVTVWASNRECDPLGILS